MCACLCNVGDSKQPPGAAFPHENEHQPASRLLTEQRSIPERLLTNKQASALLSGIPAHLRAAKAQHRESFLQLTEPGVEAEPGMQSYCFLALLCSVIQNHAPCTFHTENKKAALLIVIQEKLMVVNPSFPLA